MSFYDLTKDFVLSAKELFKYSGKRDKTLPSKGGQKDFEPEESWMQNKALEVFLQERTSVLAEPRVEKLKNLVEGIWDGDQGLINVKKPGKFWAHMGFTDKRRNWLYPEEALFLMESNTLEVNHKGVPLSIQDAYNLFLGGDVSIEEYQVFSHLRRLGFVVLRHENQPIITPYEKQINLDKYISKKSRKDRTSKPKKNKNLEQNVQSNGTKMSNHNSTKKSNASVELDESFVQTTENVRKNKNEDPSVFSNSEDLHVQDNPSSESCPKGSIIEVDKSSSGPDHITSDTEQNTVNSTVSCHESDATTNLLESKKRPGSPDIGSSHEPAKRNCLENAFVAPSSSECNIANATVVSTSSTLNQDNVLTSAREFYDSSWGSCFIGKIEASLSASNDTSGATCEVTSHKDSSTSKVGSITQNEIKDTNACTNILPLPNIASTEIVVLKLPSPHLLPDNVKIEEKPELLNYDVGKYHIMNPQREMSKHVLREEERQKRNQGLQFSFPQWMQKKPKVVASSWREYKQKLSEKMAEISETTPVAHLWNGKITPIVHPSQNWSHQSILDQLSIIKSADNDTLLPDSDCVVDVKIAFDVHLPDSQFKKSMPGVPNHRVCVSKCSSNLPGLAEILQVWSRFKDNVPLHWAVVDSGEIAFYVLDSTHTSKVFL